MLLLHLTAKLGCLEVHLPPNRSSPASSLNPAIRIRSYMPTLPSFHRQHPTPKWRQGILYVDRMLSRSFAGRGSANRLPEDVPRPGTCICCHAVDGA